MKCVLREIIWLAKKFELFIYLVGDFAGVAPDQ